VTKFVGRRGTLGIAKEVTKGVPVTPAYWIPFVTMSFNDITKTDNEEQGFGNIADQDSFYVTFVGGEGDVEAQLYDQAIPYILMSLLGAAPVTTGSNPYTHTFTMSSTNVPQTLSLYWTDPDRSYMFPQAVVESLKISVSPDQIVNYTVHFKSKTARNWAQQTASYTTVGSKFLNQHMLLKLAANVAGIAAATNISTKSLELTIDRSTIFDEVIGTVEPEDILSQSISVEGDVQLNLEDDTYRNFMLAGTYRSMQVKFLNGASSSFDLQFPRVGFTVWEPDYPLNEVAKQKIHFKANYDSANALAIISTATVINTKVSY
jgi:hypothetical protein